MGRIRGKYSKITDMIEMQCRYQGKQDTGGRLVIKEPLMVLSVKEWRRYDCRGVVYLGG